MGLGTFVGGWRIIKTVGSKITRLTPVQGTCASAGGAIMLFAATFLGIPVSTTHTAASNSVLRSSVFFAQYLTSGLDVAGHEDTESGLQALAHALVERGQLGSAFR